jgi:signal transduction histidine kinase
VSLASRRLATMLRFPPRLWGWRGSLAVSLVLLVPLVAIVSLAHGSDLAATLASAWTLALGGAVLTAGIVLYAHGQAAGNEQSGWLGVALGGQALVGLARAGYALTRPTDAPDHVGDVLLVSLAATALSCLLLWLGARPSTRFGPLVVAAPPFLALLLGQQLLLTHAWVGPVAATTPLAVVVVLATAGLGLTKAGLVLRLDALPAWARGRTALGVVLVTATTALGSTAGSHTGLRLAQLVGGLVAAVLVASTAVALLRQVVSAEQRHLAALHRRLAAAQATGRAHDARLHEISSLVAGLASASQLARDLPGEQARDLEAVVHAEIARLQRLLVQRTDVTGPVTGPAVGTVDLDEVVARIATAHRARGRTVRTPSSGLRATACPDAVAEILDVLLDNAALHGSPDDITVTVRPAAGGVEVVVSDAGPGVPLALREDVFDWGARRPGSPGQGIGLYAAAQRARDLGGRLCLDTVGPPAGACFRLCLPGTQDRSGVRHDLSTAG